MHKSTDNIKKNFLLVVSVKALRADDLDETYSKPTS